MHYTVIDKNGKAIGSADIPSAHVAKNSAGRTLVPATDVLTTAKALKLAEIENEHFKADAAATSETDDYTKKALLAGHNFIHEHLKNVVNEATSVSALNNLRWTPIEHMRNAIKKAQPKSP